MKPKDTSRPIRFGPYEADFHTQELRKHGIKLKISGQPLQVLEVLLARPGELVTRAELEQLLWPGQAFVDSNHGLNAAVNKLREALNDSASEPRYIETLPRRGYRFVGSLEVDIPETAMGSAENPRFSQNRVEVGHPEALTAFEARQDSKEMPPTDASFRGARRWTFLSTAASLFLCAVGLTVFIASRDNGAESRVREQHRFATEKVVAEASDSILSSKLAKPNSADGSVAAEIHRQRSGERILRVQSAGSGNRVILESQNTAPASSGDKTHSHLELRPVIWSDSGNAGPEFSPDGKRIAFMSNRDGPWQIWLCNADGSRPRQVSFTESAGTPRWSPDGSSIAFDAPFDGSTWIFLVQVDQSERARPVVEGLVPSFSRDGKWIYFASERTGQWQVWKTSLRDGADVQVTFKGGFAALESMDGYVYYSKSRFPQPEICRVRIQGGEESCGLQHLRPRTWASWAPTRDGIVFAEDLPDGKAALSLYDPARRQVRDLLLLQSAPFWLSASTDGKRALMNDAAERQISMVEHLH